MKGKYKMTGCARLLIFLVLFLPVLYIGVSYYQGNDPIAQIKGYFPSENNNTSDSETKPYISKERYGISDEATTKIKSKDREIEYLKTQVRDLQKEIRELKSQSHDH